MHGTRLQPHAETPRAVMRRALPAAVQPFLSWLTAQPADGEAERGRGRLFHVVLTAVLTVGGAALSAAAWEVGGAALWALPATLTATAAGMARAQVLVYHYAAHARALDGVGANLRCGEAVSIALLLKDFRSYRHEHLRHHRAARALTPDDEFVRFVTGTVGLEPGAPVAHNRRRLVRALVSPAFHLRLLRGRAAHCLASPHRGHNLAAIAWWGALAAAVSWAGAWPAFAVAWLLPLTLPLQIATTLRTVCEHRWPGAAPETLKHKDILCAMTAGVFPGSPPPAGQTGVRRALAWAGWWAELLAVHLPARLLVLPGDAPCHDYHHRRPLAKDWPRHAHRRKRDAARGCPGYPQNYTDTWGLGAAIDQTLASLAAWPPPPPRPTPTRWRLNPPRSA